MRLYMYSLIYPLIRPLLFCLPAESAHHLTLKMLAPMQALALYRGPSNTTAPVSILGMSLPNRVGLAAGLDKNGDYISGLSHLGFGFIELGTVTPLAQAGNPKPRLFRVPQAQALINRMGFNNHGVDYLCARMQNFPKSSRTCPIGINIGKNATTPVTDALSDYQTALRAVYRHADYITINISSPNTQQLRTLQEGPALSALLGPLVTLRQELAQQHGMNIPLLVKIAPDLSDDALLSIVDTIVTLGIDGIIATNTTIRRDGVQNFKHGHESGGLSGAPLTEMSCLMIEKIRRQAGTLPIVAAGGIMSAQDASDRLTAGADLIQLYSGLIYRGPQLIKECIDQTSD